MLASGHVDKFLEPHEQLGLLLAAVCHDVDHRGRNNAFMTRAHNPIGELYNAGSVMEQHHLSYTVTLLSDPQLNVLADVDPALYPAVMQQIRHVILATDLAVHFRTRGAIRRLAESIQTYALFRAHALTRGQKATRGRGGGRWIAVADAQRCKLSELTAGSGGWAGERTDGRGTVRYDRHNAEHRHLLTSLLMTASDISSILKTWDVTVDVTRAIFTEFFMQVGSRPRPSRAAAGWGCHCDCGLLKALGGGGGCINRAPRVWRASDLPLHRVTRNVPWATSRFR